MPYIGFPHADRKESDQAMGTGHLISHAVFGAFIMSLN